MIIHRCVDCGRAMSCNVDEMREQLRCMTRERDELLVVCAQAYQDLQARLTGNKFKSLFEMQSDLRKAIEKAKGDV